MKNLPSPTKIKQLVLRFSLFSFFTLFIYTGAWSQTINLQLTPSSFNGYNIDCFGSNTGSIDLTITGGTPPFTIRWSNDAITEDLTGIPAGYYNVEVDDSDPFTDMVTAEITLLEPEPIRINEIVPYVYQNGYNVSQFGACNGSVTLNVTGGVVPYTYFWEPGHQNVGNPTNLCANDNQIIITDANGCTDNSGIGLREPERDDWTMTGNSNTNPSNQFIGTIDNKDISFRTNNIERFRIKSDGKISLNTFSGAGSKLVYADSLGVLKSIPFIISSCNSQTPFLPWQANPITQNKVFACGVDFGIGTDNPREKLEVKGTVLVTSWDNSLNNMTDYLQLKHDGVNARIESFGAGDLLLNNGNPRNVKVNLGTGSGYFETGNNTYLATEGGIVGIGTTTNASSNKKLVVNGDVRFLHDIGSNQFEIMSSNILKPYRRGITISDDPTGKFNFWINGGQTPAAFNFKDSDNDALLMTITEDKLVGLGVENPSGFQDQVLFPVDGPLLHIKGYSPMLRLQNIDPSTPSDLVITNQDGYGSITTDKGLVFFINATNNVPNTSAFTIVRNHSDLNGTIPTLDMLFKVSKDGFVSCRAVNVTVSNFPDYVFKEKYNLMSIYELKNYITANKHLPGIPSAADLAKNGMDLGEIIKKQMQKIEELTLYIIQLSEQNQILKEKYIELETLIK